MTDQELDSMSQAFERNVVQFDTQANATRQRDRRLTAFTYTILALGSATLVTAIGLIVYGVLSSSFISLGSGAFILTFIFAMYTLFVKHGGKK